jgi:hypothetical protein
MTSTDTDLTNNYAMKHFAKTKKADLPADPQVREEAGGDLQFGNA